MFLSEIFQKRADTEETARSRRERKGKPEAEKEATNDRNRRLDVRVFPDGPYLPTEAGEEDLSELVSAPQLLGDSDEAGAGLRAVSRLQKGNSPCHYTATARRWRSESRR